MTEAADVVSVFDELFLASHHTCLVGGADEPLYEPRKGVTAARIYFKEDFVSSSLHEVAHWCIAGEERRKQPDYGYWYESNRSGESQSQFEAVEAKPQGLEWVLSVAAGVKFRVSIDNLDAPSRSSCAFRRRVQRAALDFVARGLPPRAAKFALALTELPDGNADYLCSQHYKELPRV